MITPESTNRKTYKSFDSHLFILWVLIAILMSASAVKSITVILVISFVTFLLLPEGEYARLYAAAECF